MEPIYTCPFFPAQIRPNKDYLYSIIESLKSFKCGLIATLMSIELTCDG